MADAEKWETIRSEFGNCGPILDKKTGRDGADKLATRPIWDLGIHPHFEIMSYSIK